MYSFSYRESGQGASPPTTNYANKNNATYILKVLLRCTEDAQRIKT